MGEKLETQVKGLSAFQKNRENPFVEKAINDIKIIQKTKVIKARDKSEISMIVSDQGEVEGYTQFLKFVEVDEEKFAKIYLSQFEAFWELSKPAIRVFGYIITKLIPTKDKFDFFLDECRTHTKYTSNQPIYSGLAALCDAQIIARGYNENVYFINPMIAFNGDRVTFARTYIKKKKATIPNQLQLL